VKIAISVPDEMFRSAGRVAGRLGLSRSELCRRALRQYIDEHSGEGVTAALDRVYADQSAVVDPALLAGQWTSLLDDDVW
jgi:metal-responsive CopG/Arc/MetJ family transcriptional regulator